MSKDELAFGRACVWLLKGVVYRSQREDDYQTIVNQEREIQAYFWRLGLRLCIENEYEYAYLRQEMIEGLPALIVRQPLDYLMSLLLVELRRKLGEHDTSYGDSRLEISVAEMVEEIKPLLPDRTDEVARFQKVKRKLQEAEQRGFLQAVAGEEDKFEVLPLLYSYITPAALQDFREKMQEYREQAEMEAEEEG